MRQKLSTLVEKLTVATGINFSYLLRGGSWAFSEQVVTNAISLLQAIAFANLISPQTYGVFSVVQSWIGILVTFALGSLPNALIKSVAEGNDGELKRGFLLKLKYAPLASLLGLGFSFYYLFIGNNTTLAYSFLIASFCMPLYVALPQVTFFLFAKGAFLDKFIVQVSVSLASLAGMTISMLYFGSVPYLMLAYFIPPIIVNGIFFWRTLRTKVHNAKTGANTERFALHLTGMSLLGSITKNIDQLLMFHFSGAVQLAVYKFALIPIRKLETFFQIILDLLLPRFAKREYREIYQGFDRKLLLSGAFSLTVVAVYFFSIPYLYKLFFPKYTDAVIYSRLLSLLFLFGPLSYVQQLWLAKAETKRLYFLKILGDSTRISLHVALIPVFGIAGAVGSRMVASSFVSTAAFILFLKDRRRYGKGSKRQSQ